MPMLLDGVRQLQRHLRLPYSTKTDQSELLAVIASNQLLFQLFQLHCPTDEPPIRRKRDTVIGGSGADFDQSASNERQKTMEFEKH